MYVNFILKLFKTDLNRILIGDESLKAFFKVRQSTNLFPFYFNAIIYAVKPPPIKKISLECVHKTWMLIMNEPPLSILSYIMENSAGRRE